MALILWLENLQGRDDLEDLGIDGKIMLEWVLGKWGGEIWAGCIQFRLDTSGWLF